MRLIKSIHYLLLTAALSMVLTDIQAQELNCEVQIQAPQVSNVDPIRFETIQESVRDFMNSRKWTNDNFEFEERIQCNMLITINNAPSQTNFNATIQIQSSRPVFNTDYNTPVFSVNDGDFSFNFLDNAMIQFSLDQHRDNLSSVLAYYAYMVIAADYDSMSLEGGTELYLKAQTVVANAQNAGESGWRASESQRNRFWLVENILSQSFNPLRKCNYYYHRHGFDKLYDDVEESRKTISDALIELRNIHRIRPSSYNVQLFFVAKSQEIIKLFEPAPGPEKQRILPILKELDPGNISKYDSSLS